MSNSILMGRGRQVARIPRQAWEQQLSRVHEHGETRLGFMTEEHHRVRNFVVLALPRIGLPLAPEHISLSLDLSLGQVAKILDDLEQHLFFLVRNDQGAVSWAFPVTTVRTPHALAFSTGERLYGA